MRRPFIPSCPGLQDSYLGLDTLHLSFMGLRKGKDPLYAVIRSSYTLYYVERYVLRLRRWAGFVSKTGQFQECAKVLRNFKIGFPFQNWLAISLFLICAVQFRKCVNLQIARNKYRSKDTGNLTWKTALVSMWKVILQFKACQHRCFKLD